MQDFLEFQPFIRFTLQRTLPRNKTQNADCIWVMVLGFWWTQMKIGVWIPAPKTTPQCVKSKRFFYWEQAALPRKWRKLFDLLWTCERALSFSSQFIPKFGWSSLQPDPHRTVSCLVSSQDPCLCPRSSDHLRQIWLDRCGQGTLETEWGDRKDHTLPETLFALPRGGGAPPLLNSGFGMAPRYPLGPFHKVPGRGARHADPPAVAPPQPNPWTVKNGAANCHWPTVCGSLWPFVHSASAIRNSFVQNLREGRSRERGVWWVFCLVGTYPFFWEFFCPQTSQVECETLGQEGKGPSLHIFSPQSIILEFL